MSRIIALSMVKNEQDVIEPFVRHTSKFVDHHIILDNESVDETTQILRSLMQEMEGVVVTPSSAFGYNQSERMTLLLRASQTAFFADFVIFLDADEFISCQSRAEFEGILSNIPSEGYGNIPWRTYVVTPGDEGQTHRDPPASIHWRRATEHERHNVVLRLDGKYRHDWVIAQGNHGVSSSNGWVIPNIRLDGLFLNHFPLRSKEQFLGKSVVGWMAYLAKDPKAYQKGEGYHWRHHFELATRGGISHEQLADLSMRYDQPHRNYDWSKDVVDEPFPFTYERRYSTGAYADPLVLTAKSWRASLMSREPVIDLERKGDADSRPAAPEGQTPFTSDWYWKNPFVDVAPFRYLFDRHRPKSVLEIGCGIGAQLSLFQKLGSETILGLDNLPVLDTVLGEDQFRRVDISAMEPFDGSFDLVMCLGVVERLSLEAASSVIGAASAHAKNLIVFSAAEPGQPGHGHVTAYPVGHWLRYWESLEWFPSFHDTLAMRALATLAWYKRNIIVLSRKPAANPEEAIVELTRIGEKPYAWHHTRAGLRLEVLGEDVPRPPFGYKSGN